MTLVFLLACLFAPVAGQGYSQNAPARPDDIKMPRLIRITNRGGLAAKPGSELVVEIQGDSDKARKFIDSIWIKYHKDFPPGQRVHYGPDSAFTQIELVHGKESIIVGSWHTAEATNPKIVATATGLASLGNRRREDVLAAQPAAYRVFRESFDAIMKAAKKFKP